jgi:hypothetical protein
MPTCNVSEIVHNIWLQQSWKNVGCLFIMTFYDYVKTFRQSASYTVYLNGGRCREGPGRDELRLRQVSQYGDPSQMANVITKYTNGSSFTIKIPHLEGQEVFGSTKQTMDITPGLKGNSHRHDHVNFFRSRINTMSSGFIS